MKVKRTPTPIKRSNVVLFPANKLKRPPQSEVELKKEVEEIRRDKIGIAYNHIFPELMQMIQGMGFHNLVEKEHIPDVALVSDALVSLLEKMYEIHNPMQEVVRRLYTIKKNRDGGVYAVNRLQRKEQKH